MSEPIQLNFQRFEFKYHLSAARAALIKEDLLGYRMRRDPRVLTNQETYPVTSLYFDNAAWGCFAHKNAGVEERAKLRFRIYEPFLMDATDTIFLEVKEKHDAVVSKKRIVVSRAAYDLFLQTRQLSSMTRFIGEKSRNTFREIRAFSEFNCLYPRVVVQYQREPLVWEFNDRLRITFDYDIKMGSAGTLAESVLIPIVPHTVIMEVKYNIVLPYWFRDIIKKYELGRVPFSKYVQGLEAWQRHITLPNYL